MTDPGASAPLSLGFLLWHATLRWQRAIAAAVVVPAKAALADQAGTDPMMTSQVVRALERKGLVVGARPTRTTRAPAG